jgi:hypothetical protein
MGDFSWSDLCDSGDEDDEDYDPFKEQPGVLEDSDSDSFEGLRHLLSPKRARRGGGSSGGGGGGAPGEGGASAEASAEVPPVAQAHWHTRTQGKLPDDVWTQTDSLLEKAEHLLDPLSPGALSDACQNEMLANCRKPEYLRLLAVARGEREPEEDEDEEDADFVPDEEEDADGAGDKTDDEARLSVSNAELSALIADNRSTISAARSVEAAAASSPGRARGGAHKSSNGKEAAEDDTSKAARPRRGRRDKKKNNADSVVRVLPFAESSSLLPFAGSAAGFSRDQCTQLQVSPWLSLLGHAHPSGRCLGHWLDAQTLPDHHTWTGSNARVPAIGDAAVRAQLLFAKQGRAGEDGGHPATPRRPRRNVPALGGLERVSRDAVESHAGSHAICLGTRTWRRCRGADGGGATLHLL